MESRGDEVEWMVAIAGGDRAAFTRLFQRYAPKIKAHLEARGAPPSSTDELTQEVMLIVWRKAGLYDPARGSVAAWLYTVSRNFLFNRARAERRLKAEPVGTEFPEPAPPPSGEQMVLTAEQQRALAASLEQLPPEQRDILEGAYWRGQTLQQCANERQLPLGTVKTRVRLALERLRGLMKVRSRE
ncbi:MAG TPA: sigma-70 family RNA polymerase sigma factor [Polyangia bacterium]